MADQAVSQTPDPRHGTQDLNSFPETWFKYSGWEMIIRWELNKGYESGQIYQ